MKSSDVQGGHEASRHRRRLHVVWAVLICLIVIVHVFGRIMRWEQIRGIETSHTLIANVSEGDSGEILSALEELKAGVTENGVKRISIWIACESTIDEACQDSVLTSEESDQILARLQAMGIEQ